MLAAQIPGFIFQSFLRAPLLCPSVFISVLLPLPTLDVCACTLTPLPDLAHLFVQPPLLGQYHPQTRLSQNSRQPLVYLPPQLFSSLISLVTS